MARVETVAARLALPQPMRRMPSRVRALAALVPLSSDVPLIGIYNNAGAVADYFLSVLYPTEGAGNLALYRTAAINFLNSSNSGVSDGTTQFTGLLNSGSDYDTRVRGMVAMLMTFKRFNEQ